jgi:serine/threonine-protein kinase
VLFPPSTWPQQRQIHPVDDAPLPTLPGYEVTEILGRGGVGVVYKAMHQRLNRPVAVKMLLSGQHASPDELERFLREAEAVAKLHHPNVVDLYDVGEVEGKPYFTMEFIEGGSLAHKLAEGPMRAREAAALVAHAMSGKHTDNYSEPACRLLAALGMGYLSHIALDCTTPAAIDII